MVLAETASEVRRLAKENWRRRRNLWLLLLIVLLALSGWAAWWFFMGRWWVNVDDAYVAGNIYPVDARVSGTVLSVAGYNTLVVRQGDPLVRLRGRRAELALSQAQAQLAQSLQDARALVAEIDASRAHRAALAAALATARQKAWRYRAAAESGATQALEAITTKNDVARLQAEIAAESAHGRALQARLGAHKPDNAPSVKAALERVKLVRLALHRQIIRAPVSGILAQQSVQRGQWVKPGQRLFSIVPLHQIWVDANVKETDLAGVRVGARVTLHADVYGSGVTYHGWVAGIGGASGAVFAVLPPENASGNWIKFTQRVPVRIALDPQGFIAHPLRPGLTMSVTIRVGGKPHQGPMPAWMETARPRAASAVTNLAARGQDGVR